MKKSSTGHNRNSEHIVKWFFVLMTYLIFLGYSSNAYGLVSLYSIILTSITLGAAGIFRKVIVPKYLDRGHIPIFIVYTMSLFLFTGILTLSLLILSVGYIPALDASGLPQNSRDYGLLMALMYLIILSLSFLAQWQKNRKTQLESSELKAEMLEREIEFRHQELQYLKGQLQPHFLFNTLNTIYGEAIKKSDETAQLVLKLSDLLNYTLYQTNKEEVRLTDELDQVRQYLELERIRFKESVSISFREDLDDDNIQVPPLLLLPLVENAFKHGVQQNGILKIDLDIKVKEGGLQFKVENTSEGNMPGSGIGLTNMKKRLEVLYPDQHQLTITHDESTFTAQLSILSIKPTLA